MSDLREDEQLKVDNEKLSAMNSILFDTAKNQENLIKHFRKMLVVVSICFTVIICAMVAGFFWYESQFDTVETESTTTTTTTDMDTSGENANINNVTNGDMYNDSATHNE